MKLYQVSYYPAYNIKALTTLDVVANSQDEAIKIARYADWMYRMMPSSQYVATYIKPA